MCPKFGQLKNFYTFVMNNARTGTKKLFNMEQFKYLILDRYETTNAERNAYLDSGNYIIVHSDTRELILKRKETNKNK